MEISFGVEQTVHIFPGDVETVDWQGIGGVLVQDLDDDALYQDFDEDSSAYVPLHDPLQPLPVIESAATATGTDGDPSVDDESSVDAVEVDVVDAPSEVEVSAPLSEPAAPEALPEEEPAATGTETEPSVSLIDSSVSGSINVFLQTTALYPLAQLSLTASTEPAPEDPVPLTTSTPPVAEAHESELHTHDATNAAAEELQETVVPTTTPDLPHPTSTSTETLDTSAVVAAATTSTSTPALLDVAAENYDITLTDFEFATLEPGQLINGMQLRLSLAGRLEEPALDAAPYIEVLYGTATAMRSVGIIPLDDEVSNAINGGYFLFALPPISDVGELADVMVTLRYHGNRSDLDGLYLDAAWLELDTRIVTKADLLARGMADQLVRDTLRLPEVSTLVSDQLNFRRDEVPVFNLRYNSQRNFMVRGIRSVFGKDLVAVEEAAVVHSSVGPLAIEPTLNVTKDGLLTIAIPDEALREMRPGTYEVQLTLNEGGKEVLETFNFEWGILSINPNKSEYQVGETAEVAMGAITPNGNTICEANLDLYVVDPAGFVARYAVEESGLCQGNNVVTVPDFSAEVPVEMSGVHELYLERLDDKGDVLGFTTDTFNAVMKQDISIERNGPTRIYPPAPYAMTLTVSTTKSFTGTLTEELPASFAVYDTDAKITSDGITQTLQWELDLLGGRSESVSYQFDAPDLSPYLFTLGPARLDKKSSANAAAAVVSSTTASSSVSAAPDSGNVFIEHRRWQIASDATGNMILFWTDGSSIPTGWSCLSCGSGTFYQRFVMGSSTYNSTGGAATHGHTGYATAANTTSGTIVETKSGAQLAANTHTHTVNITSLSSTSSLPEYRQLRVIQYTSAAGEPATIPAGAVAIFDVASSSLPSGWNRYNAQDGKYIYGEDTIGTTGGSNTHTHPITGTLTGLTGTIGRNGGGPNTTAVNAHTHTYAGDTAAANNEPPYVEVVLAELSADAAPPVGMISMWTEDVPAGWNDVSSNPGDAFSNKFIKPATSYSATGGATAHAHASSSFASSAGILGTTNTGKTTSAVEGVVTAHTHTMTVSTDEQTHLPPYITAVFGKRIGLNANFNQLEYRWYANALSQTPTDPWSSGATIDLALNEPITATSTPVKDGDLVRLRISALVENATSSAGEQFKLQFATSSVCSAITVWNDVGASASSTVWRGYDVSGVSDGGTLSSLLLPSSTVAATYEENGATAATPNDIGPDGVAEWDFVLEQNGAVAGANYCFRMVKSDDSPLYSYLSYPQLFTNEAPAAPTLQKLFDNEKTASTSPWFYFTSTDAESDKVHYQIQIDNNYDFGSAEVDKNTVSHSSQFENQVLISDKAPFIDGDLIEFVPSYSFASGTTYYWRVRAQDPDGSGDWGDWSSIRSFTIDPNINASAWFQTEDEQFDTNSLSGVETGSDQVALISGSTTGTMRSSAITFTDGALGTAWDSLTFTDTETAGDIAYHIQYLDATSTWVLIPDSDLSGNAAGFDAPVSLLGLDVDTYGVIRILADFTNSGGSPSLQDWTIKWGYRVDTPTISKLFPNEQTGTTTPTLEFTTSDPQGDGLTYEVSWSTTPDFSASTTRNSTTTPTGFVNIDNGGNVDPFYSGDTIQYTIQPGDALTGTTTYWWRVRAKDSGTGGDDAWSFWTDPQSFTVIPGTELSTWFQTTEEQFDTNILSGTLSLGSDVVTVATTASEAMIVYGEGTETEPRYRTWNGSVWSAEGQMNDIGSTLRWAVVQAGTTREEYVAGTVGSDAHLTVQVYSTGEWSSPTTFTTSAGVNSNRGFDVAYETTSGRAMVVYCDGDSVPSYRIWNGSTWSSATAISASALTDDCRWIDLASDPTSDELALIMRGVGGGLYQVLIWDPVGGTWGNSSTFGSSYVTAYAGQSIAYEDDGSEIIAIAPGGSGNNRFVYNSWNGSTWTTTNQTISGRLHWGTLTQGASNLLAMCYQADGGDVRAIRWTGAAWAGDTQLSATINAATDPGFACEYQSNNDIVAAYSNTAATNYQTYTGTWSGGASLASLSNTDTMQLVRTGTGLILGAFFDGGVNDSLEFSNWNGSSWSTSQTLETNMSVDSSPFGQPYYLAPRNSASEGTTIVSPGVDFDDGTGPYWKTFSWNDTQPGTSQVLYSLQYFDTASNTWKFIPDTDLPGNETGTTTGPYDLSALNTNTYNVIRPYAQLSCDGSSNCPEIQDWKIEWAGGITVSGTIQQYDQSANVNSGTVAVAVNGVLQTGKTGTISAGAWSISNVTVFPGDIVTVFVSGANDANEAVGVARYDGQGDMSGMTLFERHLSLGSNDATTTAFTNAEIGQYDYTNTEDVFFDLAGTTLTMCADVGCADAELYIQSGARYTPGGRIVTHDLENNGTFTAGSYTHEVNGSWDNNGTTTMTGSTIVMAATSTTEAVDSTGAVSASFNNLTFGTTTGSGTWTLPTALDVNGALTVSRGTLARGTTSITVAGNLVTGVNGFWTGLGTTTFDGSTGATWQDQNATLQNVGRVVVDGANKIVTLAGNVAAESVTIGADDTLDASASHYDITVYGSWVNGNNFLPRNGEVFFAATNTGQTITTAGDAFYDLSFIGVGGGWSFTEATLLVNNDLSIATGTVTLPPNGTTTIAGSFDATDGAFAHNNGVLYFTGAGAETITFNGGLFTNVAHNLTFNGGGTWAILDTNATATSDVRVEQGTVTFPSGVLAIGGTLTDAGGAFNGGAGTVRFYSGSAEVVTAGGSSFNNLTFDGAGSWSFADANVDAAGDLTVAQGTLTLPSGTFSIAGSYDNAATVNPGTGTVLFDSTDTGETIDLGGSALFDVILNGVGGGWTIVEHATTTGDFTIATSSDFTLASGRVLSVGDVFTNSVGGASTTWTGATLALRAGDYSINTKYDAGDAYEILDVAAGTHIAMWNSLATTSQVAASGSLYSQDHAGADGDLYIWGAYQNNAGSEYWSYATDFDGADLSGVERPAAVRFAAGASASFASSTFEILGGSAASTTIANQGAGSYTLTVSGGTTTAQYYEFADLGATGVTLTDAAVVPTLRDGSYIVGVGGGTALTLSSTTIDANPAKQIFNVAFATTTAIAGTNVTQTDGTPASFWWFRNGQGNLYGENYDNDTGDPGSVRFDDSSLLVTIAGTVFDAALSPIIGGTCDGVTPVVRVMVSGALATTTPCSNVDGSYSAPNVVVIGDPTITVFLSGASGGERGSAITRTPTGDILDMDIYTNRVIVRNEDTEPLSIANLAVYDSSNDPDLQFTAATSTGDDTLVVHAGTELRVFATSTFTPDGIVTLNANAGANGYDGTLYLANGSTFNAYSTSTLTIGGRLVLESAAALDAATTTVLMNATTTGKSITSLSLLTFNDLAFNGSNGGWNLGADIQVDGDLLLTAGTLTGTGDITLPIGSFTGNGTLSLGGGTTTMAASNSLGGTTAWTFYNLALGDTFQVGTTTPLFTSTTTVSGRLTINAAHYFDAGATAWDLSGAGTVFVEDGTFIEDTSTIRYSGAGANVLSTQYYNLDINAGVGSPTFTATGLGMIVDGDLTIGGDANSTFDLTTADPLLDVNGDVIIHSNGTLLASNSNTFTIAGDYSNSGTFTSNGGTLTFDGSGTTDIAAGASSFGSVLVSGTGDVTLTETATTTNAFTLSAANSFTLASGEVLAVGGTFFNAVGGAATDWSNTTLRLYGGGNYSLNAATTSDTYATLDINDTTQVRMWNSDASTYDVAATASLYSQDHAGNDGDLYIWGAYRKNSGTDHWSYASDFDGTALGGSSRKVDVYIATSSSVTYTGGSLGVIGSVSASTTVQAMGTSNYGLVVGGTASTTWRYYEVRDTDANGVVFTATPKVNGLSYGDIEVSVNGGTAMTVGGTVINNNPAKNFTGNRFALNGVASGFNVTATGTSVSSWRFVNHYGGRDGEAYDVDPDGDPGYVAWDDSAALITISGNVYEANTSSVSSACTSGYVTLMVAGLSQATTTCNTGTGAYSFTNVSYGTNDSLVVYITDGSAVGAAVTKQPISNITGLDLYENHVIVRHENINAITIADMATWDSSDDAAIPFTAVDAATDTLTLPADTKLIVWTNKEFAPGGNVTLSGGGAGAAYDGTLELYDGATWTGAGTESLTIGGSLLTGSGAAFVASNGTTTFTTTGSGRTIGVNSGDFHHVAFTGSGSWSVSDPIFTVNGNYTQSAGTLTFPSGTSTFSGSFVNSGGAFNANNGTTTFAGSGTQTVTLGGSDLAAVIFESGSYAFGDTNATTTKSLTITGGTLTLPSGTLAVGGDFANTDGAITHNTAELIMTSPSSSIVQASSSDLYSVRFTGGSTYQFVDEDVALLGDLTINSGSVTLASGTLSIGGSFAASGGTFSHATGTMLFNSTDGGETIDPGSSDFYNVQISAPTGGYTLIGNATTTNNFALASANSFTIQSGVTLVVENVFSNLVGGANTTWSGSTLKLDGSNAYTINPKGSAGDQYDTLIVGANSDLRFWNSAATTTTVDPTSSVYSQDHGGSDGALYVFGDFHISTTTEYWSYATDFDGTDLSGGSERAVIVAHAANATTSVDGGTLRMVGVSGNETAVTNQGSGTYAMQVSAGTFLAQYYSYRNLAVGGLALSGTPVISSLSYGDYELAVNGGTLISLSSTTLNANASLIITGNRFATTTAITGYNVTLTGVTSNAWTFVSHTGNLDGEAFDVDGATACGSVRWNDSSCLLTQQTNYRWRNDDGGLGVPNSEWYDSNWDARQYVRLYNADANTYTNAAVKLLVTYDADMQADFDDLRFTDSTGTTIIPHFVASSTNALMAEVWVQVPSLAAEDTTDVYMYYNNPTATTTASSTLVFVAADDFDDGNISEYSGETVDFTVDATFAYGGSSGLEATSVTGRTESGGIYTLAQTVSQGETIRFKQYLDVSETDETCVTFGVQSTGAPADNYGLCVDLNGTDRIVLVKDAVDSADTNPAVDLASSSISVVDGWYTFEIEWGTDDTFAVDMWNEAGSSIATLSASDSSYTSGGFGFTFWFQHGGWDNFSSRPTLTTEPTVTFGAEQTDGGASWNAAQNTTGIYDVADVARLRLSIENSGLAITNQQFRLEYAALGAAPSCESVATGNYQTVPVQSSCGTSPVCMVATGNYTNGAATADLLSDVSGAFTAGEAREDPSNTTGNLDIAQNEYTELEYAVTPTINVVDENLCFRVTNAGSELDTYLRVAQLNLRFDPVLGAITLNNGQPISLLPGTTTQVYATGTVSDYNGYTDIILASSTFYRSGVVGGAACAPDNNNCYISTTANKCQFTDCVGNSCTVECYADVYFHADPTDITPYEGEEWLAFIEVEDAAGGYDFGSTPGVELETLRAIDVSGVIDYGSLAVNSDTGGFNASTSVFNEGNVEVDLEITGTDLSDGITSVIPADQQKFATSTFTYSSCGAVCELLSSTTAVGINVDLAKPTVDAPPVEDDVYWGIAIPIGVNSSPHSGINVFTPVSP